MKIAGIKCAGHDITLHTVPIDCVVKSPNKHKGKVLIQQFSKAVVSTNTFKFVDPKIVGFNPRYGPMSGGTLITIDGQFLYAGRKISAYIGDLPCYINTSNKNDVVCKNVQSNDTNSFKLRMTFDNATREFSHYGFEYKSDPTIVSVETAKFNDNAPKCIPAGGLDVIVHGTNLNVVQKTSLYVDYGGKHFYSDCTTQTDTMMTCTTPTINNADSNKLDPNHPTELEFGFIMDNVASVRDLSSKGLPKFQLYPDPKYDPFPELIRYIEHSLLTIVGQNLNQCCKMSDVRVYIGQNPCNITSLSQNSLECQPPQLFDSNE